MKILHIPLKHQIPNWLCRLAALMLFFTLSIAVQAQVITGTVTDEYGDGVIGANVIVTNTTIGTSTDIDGSFSLDVQGNKQIEVSYLGYTTQKVNLDGRANYAISLTSDAELLGEVVVVGYGTQKKSDLTGAVASIKGKELTQIATGNPTAALQGKLPGIQVESFGGQPGAPANVFVRGVGSLTNSFPLYVIDGTFADNMNFINPNDIESIEVLKDASSAAIYGSRASNGVVIISTKSGDDSGKTRVNLSLKTGIESPSKRLNYLNSEQFLDFREDLEENDATGFLIDRDAVSQNGSLIYTDWQDESFKNGPMHDIGISAAGGGDNSNYFISTNFFQQDGILVGSGFERFNLRGNSEFKLGGFTLSQSLGLAQTKTQENEWFGFEAATAPILALENEDNLGGFEAPDRDVLGFGGINNYALASLEDNLDTKRNLLGNVSAAYEIIDGLTAKISLGAEYTNGFKRTFRPAYFMSATDARFNDNPENDLTHVRSEILRTQIEPTLSYQKELNDHNIGVVLGTSRIVSNFDLLGTYVGNLPSDDLTTVGTAGVDNILGSAGSSEVDALLSAFGRITYAFQNKYLLTATIRQDESSKFAPGFRKDIFPSFSVGWRVSKENFWPNSGAFSSLKLRFGYGELGAQNVGNYLYQSVVGATSAASFGNGILPGFAQTSFANESLQWETSKSTNVGADFEFLDGRIAGSIEYYIKDIDNLLVAVPIPASNGTSVPVTQNAGGLLNKGIEFEMDFRKKTGDFQYDLGFNVGTQSSILDALPNEFFGPSVNEDLQSVNIFREGEAPGSFYGFEVTGIDSETGEFIFTEGEEGPEEMILGSPVPDFTYGINLNTSYKKFDIGLFFNGVQGNEIYNQSRAFNTLFPDGNKLDEVLDRWTPENTNGTVPKASSEARPPSSFFVEDGSYFRFKNLSIGYDIGDALNLRGVEGIRLSLTGQNLFVLTNYSGYDPDVASTNGARSNENDGFFGFRPTVNSITGRGIDIRAYPSARSILFGVDLTF